MPNITADQLEAYIAAMEVSWGPLPDGITKEFGEFCRVCCENRGRLIWALRALEVLEASVANHATTGPVSDYYKLTWRGRVAFSGSVEVGAVWDACRLDGEWWWALSDGKGGLADGETGAKLAVEKAALTAVRGEKTMTEEATNG